MNAGARLFLGMAVILLAGAAHAADSDSDIVWPTYSQVTFSTDAALSCSQLRDRIQHVTDDIAMLTKARQRVEDIIQSQITFSRSHGTVSREGTFQPETSDGSSEKGYVQAHSEIGTSHGIAVKRLDYLNLLEKTCKNTAP
ncbi:MAG TPA: hypothetical protein VIJ72_03990 [Rhizomicrobium sp.]